MILKAKNNKNYHLKMSKKYLEQFSGTGVSTKKVVSKFGSKILGKLGWNE